MSSKVIASGKAVLIGSFISKGISIVSSVILARLLFEKDYGAMVLAAIFAGLITQIGGMGYELYYLQHKGNEAERRKVLEQVYNLRLVTNIVMFVVQALIGLYLFLFTPSQMSGGILMLMSVSLLLEGFNAPQETLLKDKMEFRKITIGNIFKELFATIGKVTAAFLGFGGFSFGVGPILGSFVRLIYLRKVQPYKHDYFLWDKTISRKAFNFGFQNLLGAIGMYIVQQVDRIFLTMFFPQKVIGQYGFAWGNASMPFNYLVAPQQQLIVTYNTRYHRNDPVLFDKLLVIQRLITILLYPVLIIALFYTDEIIAFVFTERWLPTVPLVKILTLYYAIMCITFPFNSILTGLGYPKINTIIVLIKAVVLISFLYLSNILFTGNILIYLTVFCSISVFFDFVKFFVGTSKTGITFYSALNKMKFDFIMFIVLLVIFLISESHILDLNKSVFSVFLFFILLINIFVIEKKRSVDAINLIIRK